MDCPECDEALDVSETKPSYLRCRDCRLLFVVTEGDELQPFAVQAPAGIDAESFFASFTQRLGFVDDDG